MFFDIPEVGQAGLVVSVPDLETCDYTCIRKNSGFWYNKNTLDVLLRWFKKGSCQFLVKECAQYWLTA